MALKPIPRKHHFLELPFEIRQSIYGAILDLDEPLPPNLTPSRSYSKPLYRPKLVTSSILRCSRQVYNELLSTMKLWQKTGRAKYILHVLVFSQGEPARLWTRITVPVTYIHTLQLDIHSRGSSFYNRALAAEIYKIIFAFLEHGPELSHPHKLEPQPFIEVLCVNLNVQRTQINTTDIELEDPSEAPISSLFKCAISDMLKSYLYNDLRNSFGRCVKRLRIKCDGYVFERLLELEEDTPTNQAA